MSALLAIILGYLIGSLSPAYALGRILKNIDIRKYGDSNAGTVNVYRVLGFWPAAVTALVDVSKGLIAYFCASKVLGLPLPFAFLAPAAAIVGHVAPFYLKFRGGQGVATAVGLLLYGLGSRVFSGQFPLSYLLFFLLIVASFAFITRSGEMVGIIVLPLLGFSLFIFSPSDAWLIFLESLLAYIFLVNLYNTLRQKRILIGSKMRQSIRWWRFFLRPVALIFPVLYQMVGENFTMTLLGAVALASLTLDISRLAHEKINHFLFKKLPFLLKPKEERRISSITQFLISVFLIFLLFRFEIALLALLFLIFGDMAAKFFGLQFGRHRVFGKTLEGSLSFLLFCLIIGLFYSPYAALPWGTILSGALAATLAEGMPWGLDDNLTITMLSASAMHLTQWF